MHVKFIRTAVKYERGTYEREGCFEPESYLLKYRFRKVIYDKSYVNGRYLGTAPDGLIADDVTIISDVTSTGVLRSSADKQLDFYDKSP